MTNTRRPTEVARKLTRDQRALLQSIHDHKVKTGCGPGLHVATLDSPKALALTRIELIRYRNNHASVTEFGRAVLDARQSHPRQRVCPRCDGTERVWSDPCDRCDDGELGLVIVPQMQIQLEQMGDTDIGRTESGWIVSAVSGETGRTLAVGKADELSEAVAECFHVWVARGHAARKAVA